MSKNFDTTANDQNTYRYAFNALAVAFDRAAVNGNVNDAAKLADAMVKVAHKMDSSFDPFGVASLREVARDAVVMVEALREEQAA